MTADLISIFENEDYIKNTTSEFEHLKGMDNCLEKY